MKKEKIYGWILILFMLTWLPASHAWTDGGYFSRELVAVSADQRAIIIKNGNEISMTFSTGYTGEGEDFGWIIPTPVPPATQDVSEAGENGETVFKILDEYSAPVITSFTSNGCFPSGTEVLTASGSRPIETVDQEDNVYACNLATGEWALKKVLIQKPYQYEGDMIAIRIGQIKIQATGNHPFYVLRGDRLASRPLPQDIPKEEQIMTEHGRWVEARDLKEGDVLKKKSGEGLIVTSLSSRYEKTEVYHLEVESYHNYAVHRVGILVHNGGGGGGKEKEKAVVKPELLVTVYGKVTLEHYEVSILGAADALALLNWLQENGYQVNPAAQEVLDTYIDQNWAFVAVKLNPSEKRHYENEFLPPLTIKYQYDQLIYPLRISSVSTTQNAKITLYVIAESTVTSSNFPTTILKYEDHLSEWVDSEKYIETCIQRTTGSEGRGLVVIWSGELFTWVYQKANLNELMKIPFSEVKKNYLTRLETRMDPAAMIEDIRFILDPRPNEFWVEIYASAGYGSELIVAARDGETDTVRKLLETGANVHAKDDRGETALRWAALNGHSEIVRVLLNAGSDVYAEDKYGFTALMEAARHRPTETVKVLLDAGADVNAKTTWDRTAMYYARKYKHWDVWRLLRKSKVKK